MNGFTFLSSRPPLYISGTARVFEAKDSRNQQNVALKVMKDKEQFEKELVLRERVYSEGKGCAVIDIQEAIIVCDNISEIGEDLCTKLQRTLKNQGARVCTGSLASSLGQFEAGQYVSVMPLADRDLATMMSHERFAGRELIEIRNFGKDIAQCLTELHKCEIVHGNTCTVERLQAHCAVTGDLKPRNCLRDKSSQKLILTDLDAANELGGAIGTKAMASSAYMYVPPEEAHRLHSVMSDQSVSQQVLRVQKVEDVDSTPLGITADFSYE